jgi:hypothetical protein
MKIQVLYFYGCNSYERALEQLENAMKDEGVEDYIEVVRVSNDTEAKKLRFLGSPTIQINGKDVEREARMRSNYGMRNRQYWSKTGQKGIPSDETVRAALREAKK